MKLTIAGRDAYIYTGGRAFDAARPTIVFIHGAGHDHSVWTLQTRYFASHGWNVIAPDLPGHGRSAGPALESIEALADWILALLARLGCEQAMLVGHSMGSLIALEAAARVAQEAGITPHILGDSLEGEARDVGKVMAAIARQVALYQQPFQPPCVLLSGGETTVTVRGSGRGGRNVEYLLSLGVALDGLPNVYASAGDTDGVDGQEEIAGAYLAPDSLKRAWAKGIRPKDALADNDGHGFFGALGDSIVTGPTLTNVNDFRAVLIL